MTDALVPYRRRRCWRSGPAHRLSRHEVVQVVPRFVQVYMREESASMWVAMKKALLNDWFRWTTDQITLDGTFDDKLWIPHSEVNFADCKALCTTVWIQWLWNGHPWHVPPIPHHDTFWRRSVSFCVARFPTLCILYSSGKVKTGNDDSMKRVTIAAFYFFVLHSHMHHAGAKWEESSRSRYHAYFILSQVSLETVFLLHTGRLFPFVPFPFTH